MLFLELDQTTIHRLDGVSAKDVQLTALDLEPEGIEKVAAFVCRDRGMRNLGPAPRGRAAGSRADRGARGPIWLVRARCGPRTRELGLRTLITAEYLAAVI